ncbi:MAG: S41 family peptidase [Chitinophagaceae bacterium]|nr:S41 family peptidase [Chitinophagaceae bacterium]
MMKEKKLQVWMPLLLGTTMALGMLFGFQLAGNSGRAGNSRTASGATQQLLDLLRYKYVDSVRIDTLETQAIETILQHLDPHTVFIPARELADANADLEGGFSGIGVEYLMINDTATVVYVVENGPSEKAGLQAGDQIVQVGNEPIAGKKMQGPDLRRRIRGAYNSQVSLGILRQGQPKTVTITRGNIPLPSVDAWYMATPTVGYLRINKFAETTYREFMDAANALLRQGMKKMVLDLRGNTGGYLTAATNVADELLPDNLKLVSTRGLHTKEKVIYSSKPGLFETGDLVVLLDEFSASASEVLAGSLQDNDRGTVVGRRSFGKGLVQEQYDLSNGGAVRLTVARYYTPTGRSIQKPFNGNRGDYMHEVLARHGADSLQAQLTDKVDSSQVFKTRKGKILYGGGGISPDVLVAFDTTRIPKTAIGLYNNGLLSDFSFLLFRQQQAAIRGYSSARAFAEGWQLPANAWERLLQMAAADSIQIGAVPASIKADVLQRVKANTARYVWRGTGYVQVMQPGDRVLQKALEILK